MYRHFLLSLAITLPIAQIAFAETYNPAAVGCREGCNFDGVVYEKWKINGYYDDNAKRSMGYVDPNLKTTRDQEKPQDFNEFEAFQKGIAKQNEATSQTKQDELVKKAKLLSLEMRDGTFRIKHSKKMDHESSIDKQE